MWAPCSWVLRVVTAASQTNVVCWMVDVHSTMGAIDGFDRVANTAGAQLVMASSSFQMPLMCSLLLMLTGNALSLWRLGKRECDLDEAWPCASKYVRRLREAGTFNDFIVDCAIDLLLHHGNPPARAARAAGAADEAEGIGTSMTNADMRVLEVKLASLKQYKQRRAWFRSEDGKRFRTYKSAQFPHLQKPSAKRGVCVLCSKAVAVPPDEDPDDDEAKADGNPRPAKRPRIVREGAHKSRFECSECHVRLCRASKRHPRTCFHDWHTANVTIP